MSQEKDTLEAKIKNIDEQIAVLADLKSQYFAKLNFLHVVSKEF